MGTFNLFKAVMCDVSGTLPIEFTLPSFLCYFLFRTFEEKNLGQIKTVYPDAYVFRQERRLQCYGRKDVGYNLTLEPDIQGIQGVYLY